MPTTNVSLRTTWATLTFMTACAPAVAAGNLSFLNDSAVSKFDDEDMRLMSENVRAVADDEKTPAQRSWKNAASGHSGSVESLKAFVSPDGLACKKLRVTNIAGDRHSRATYTMCKSNEGDWRLAPKDLAGAA